MTIASRLRRWSRTAPLRKAEHLAANGGHLDAIDLLTAANRQNEDPAIERRLVELRHDAFAGLTESAHHAVWPPTMPDILESNGSPPVIHRKELHADTLGAGILHHGSLLVRELLTDVQVERLRDVIDRAFAAQKALGQGATVAETSPWFVPFAPGNDRLGSFGREKFIRTVDSPKGLFELVEAFTAAGLPDVLESYLGERPAIGINKCCFRRAEAKAGVPDFHQDGAFLARGIRTVNVWVALTRCGGGTEAPGLDLVPRRVDHVIPAGGDGAFFDWTLPPERVARVAPDAPFVSPTFEPGDALLFDELLVHRTGVAEGMHAERLAVESWLFAPSHYPDDQVPAVF